MHSHTRSTYTHTHTHIHTHTHTHPYIPASSKKAEEDETTEEIKDESDFSKAMRALKSSHEPKKTASKKTKRRVDAQVSWCFYRIRGISNHDWRTLTKNSIIKFWQDLNWP